MKPITISVTYGRTFNLGDYNNARIDYTIGAELEEGDDPTACAAQLFADAKGMVKAQALPLFTKLIDERLEIIANLPPEYRDDFVRRLQERIGTDAR